MGRAPLWAPRSECPAQLLPARAGVSGQVQGRALPAPQPHWPLLLPPALLPRQRESSEAHVTLGPVPQQEYVLTQSHACLLCLSTPDAPVSL